MSNSGVLLEALVSFYGNLSLDVVNALSATRQDIRTGDFNLHKALGRAINIWLDGTEGWLGAVLVTASQPLPTAYLTVGRGSTATADVSILVKEKPHCTDLFQIGGSKRIDSKHVILDPSTKGDRLTVRLPGLARVKSQIAPGLYQGLIYTGGKPLAVVMLRYDPSSKEGEPEGTVPYARKRKNPAKKRKTPGQQQGAKG